MALIAGSLMGIPRDVWVALGLGLPLLLLALLRHYSVSLATTRKGTAKVPPGRFWQVPMFGETLQLLSGSSDQFMLPRIKKYGKTFRTHLFGQPAICTTSMEAAKFLLQSPALFELKMSSTIQVLMGKEGITNSTGEMHARYRRLIQSPINSENLKNFTADVDAVARAQVWEWGHSAVLNTHDELRKFTFNVTLLFCCNNLVVDAETNKFRKNFKVLSDGFLGLPINFPGTRFSKALKAREHVRKFMHGLLKQRRDEKGSAEHADLLDSFMNSVENGSKLSDEQVADNILSVFFAGHDTSAIALIWILHKLVLYPNVLEQVKAENDALARERKHVDDPLAWHDLKKLSFTLKVMQETLRTVNIVPFHMREAKEDVVFDGMLFPKGWKLLVWNKFYHVDPELHPEPLKFNPSRFEVQPKVNSFTPLGSGPRVCPGAELAKMEILIFLHRFVTTYDFEPTGQSDVKVSHWPTPRPEGGLPLRITRRSLPVGS